MDGIEKSGCLFTEQFKKIKAVGCRAGILQRLFKVYEPITDVSPQFRRILSATGTPSYKIAKFLVPKFSSSKYNEFTVKDSLLQVRKLFMQGFDVDSLFTNIPLEETINICTNFFITMMML